MLKVMTYFRRRDGLDVGAMQAHWRGDHAALARRLPGLRRYIQAHPLPGGYGRADPPLYDGMSSAWFDDEDALRAALTSPAYAALAADEAAFTAPGSLGRLRMEETVITDGPVPADGIKSMTFLPRRPGLTPEAFQRYWREIHGPIAAAIPTLRRYVQNHVALSSYRDAPAPAYDGIPEAWFDSVASMPLGAGTPELARLRDDEPNLFVRRPGATILTREVLVV